MSKQALNAINEGSSSLEGSVVGDAGETYHVEDSFCSGSRSATKVTRLFSGPNKSWSNLGGPLSFDKACRDIIKIKPRWRKLKEVKDLGEGERVNLMLARLIKLPISKL